MSTFITFANEFINIKSIRRLRAHDMINYGRYLGQRPGSTFPPEVDTTPAESTPYIELWVYGQKLDQKFDSKEERDAALLSLQNVLKGKMETVFPNLSLRVDAIQSVHCSWTGSPFMTQTLVIRIKTEGAPEYKVEVGEKDEPEMNRAKEFLARFNLEVPETPEEKFNKIDL